MMKSTTSNGMICVFATACAFVFTATAADALGLKECSDKYTAAKTAKTAGNKTFAEFQKSDCGPDAKPVAAPAAAAVPAAAPAGPAVFPSAISAAHKDKKPSKARMATCLDQYKVNKTNKSNGGLKWIQKGGGYYSQCNKKLKELKA
jgi:hypothetical protein